MQLNFGEYTTNVILKREIPFLSDIERTLGLDKGASFKPVLIADENTSYIAEKIRGSSDVPLCVIKSGEENKNWQSVEKILSCAFKAGLGRDGIFTAVGGGVICDIAGFASSIYMRGCRLVFVSTTLLGMVDASIGGKTGFDLFDIKNLAGSFYPAEAVFLPVDALSSLPEKEWKNGTAELIKTAILSGGDFLDELADNREQITKNNDNKKLIINFIERAAAFKGGIVTEDLRESENGKRKLLNLGHTFAHALESAAGLGKISHGEAVAWGIVRACELGRALGITPGARAEKIINLISSSGYECSCPHPLTNDTDALLSAMKSDKKKQRNKMTFIVPDETSARSIVLESESEIKLLNNILGGNI